MRAGGVFAFVLLCLASLSIGARDMAWTQLLHGAGDEWLTLTASRLPRLAALVLTGVGLAVCGVTGKDARAPHADQDCRRWR